MASTIEARAGAIQARRHAAVRESAFQLSAPSGTAFKCRRLITLAGHGTAWVASVTTTRRLICELLLDGP